MCAFGSVSRDILVMAQWRSIDLTDFLNQRDRDYCIGMGANVCGAGGL